MAEKTKNASVHWPIEMGVLNFDSWFKLITPDEMVTERGSSLNVRTVRRSVNSFDQIFAFSFCEREAPNGIPSSHKSVAWFSLDFAGSSKKIWSISEPNPHVLDTGWEWKANSTSGSCCGKLSLAPADVVGWESDDCTVVAELDGSSDGSRVVEVVGCGNTEELL